MQLRDKVIIITGAAQGLGRAMAEQLARAGAQLALVDLDTEKLEHCRLACTAAGVTARAYRCNVAQEAEVIQLVQQVTQDFGALNGLVNNAGILRDGLTVKLRDGQLSTLSLQQWQSVIDVNLTGVFLCTREVAAYMVSHQQQGVIINLSSIARAGNIGQANYAAAKAGVVADTVVWAGELARYGIRVAAVAPGFIETEMTASMKPEALARMTSSIPLARMGKPAEIAHAVQFIFENDYFNGRVLELDGGLRF